MPPPADDCLAPGLDDPNTAVQFEPFPGSQYPSSLPACETVRAVLSAGPSGASDWVGFQDLYDTARGIIDLCECPIFVRPLRCDDFPIGGTKRDDTSTPRYVQILGVRRSAVYRWKPGIWFAAASYSVPGRRRVSGVAPAPVSPCRSRSDNEYCSGGISLPRSDCVIQLLPLSYQLDGYSYDLMMEFVGDGCFALTLHAGGLDFGSGSLYCHSFASVIGLMCYLCVQLA